LYAAPSNLGEYMPTVQLRVTVQQKTNEKIDKDFHILELLCWNNDCSLTSVSLNQCHEFQEGKAFYPKVQFSATWMENLKVTPEGNSLIVQEIGSDIFGDYITTLRFDYEPVQKDKIATKLLGFSGGFVKNSVLVKEVLTVNYIPLPKKDQIIKLDCGVLLPGIENEQKRR